MGDFDEIRRDAKLVEVGKRVDCDDSDRCWCWLRLQGCIYLSGTALCRNSWPAGCSRQEEVGSIPGVDRCSIAIVVPPPSLIALRRACLVGLGEDGDTTLAAEDHQIMVRPTRIRRIGRWCRRADQSEIGKGVGNGLLVAPTDMGKPPLAIATFPAINDVVAVLPAIGLKCIDDVPGRVHASYVMSRQPLELRKLLEHPLQFCWRDTRVKAVIVFDGGGFSRGARRVAFGADRGWIKHWQCRGQKTERHDEHHSSQPKVARSTRPKIHDVLHPCKTLSPTRVQFPRLLGHLQKATLCAALPSPESGIRPRVCVQRGRPSHRKCVHGATHRKRRTSQTGARTTTGSTQRRPQLRTTWVTAAALFSV